MRRLLVFFLLLAAACASSSGARPSDVARPDIHVRQAGSIVFDSGSHAPVTIDVHITNNATVPLRVREIEVSSPYPPGMMLHDIRRKAQTFNETIAPGESRPLRLVAAVVSRSTQTPSSGPLGIMAKIRFEANGRGFMEVVLERFEGVGG
ncbi:MAG TPA: hypothetical protein VF432_33150 [Thermoanaerobaculia bacterium]